MKKSRVIKALLAAVFLFYLFTVLWFTVLSRSKTISVVHLDLFWSYREWFARNGRMGRQILGNIAMFIPFGFLGTALISGKARKGTRPERKTFAVIALCALAFSGVIEGLQLALSRGTFEFDDLFSNTLGGVIGYVIFKATGRWKWLTMITAIACTAVCGAVLVKGGELFHFDPPGSPKNYCFQAETVENRNGDLLLTGVAFRYNHPEWTGTIVLQETETKEQIVLETQQTARPEVNEYFLCEQDYTMSGFRATGKADPEKEYEILVRFPLSGLLNTGTYITGDRIHYVPDAEFRAPEAAGTDLEAIIRDGTLRVFRPDYHCWVYQVEQKLYWIAEEGFTFEEDGTTLIQYHLYTTQKDKLPEKRLKYHNYWDNISGHFEKYELKGDFGPYRVSCRKIPDEYSITSIMTGYYKNGKWIWGEYFRPIYHWPAKKR